MEVCFVFTLLWDKAGRVHIFSFLFQMPLWHRIEEKYQRRSLLLSLKIHSTHITDDPSFQKQFLRSLAVFSQ